MVIGVFPVVRDLPGSPPLHETYAAAGNRKNSGRKLVFPVRCAPEKTFLSLSFLQFPHVSLRSLGASSSCRFPQGGVAGTGPAHRRRNIMTNRVTLVGRIGREPELRTTFNQKSVATFSMCTSRRWTDRDTGAVREENEWHRVVVFGGQANFAAKLAKGTMVLVEGAIHYSKYEKDGETRYSTEIRAEKLEALSRPKAANEEPAPEAKAKTPAKRQSKAKMAPTVDGLDDDDIPF